jgi:hypothetical protein
MDEYFNYNNSNFKTEILDKIVEKKYDSFSNSDGNVWEVSVTQYHDEKNPTIKTAEIFVYMEVIDGELNANNTSSVSCSFLDEKLSEMFKKLTSSQGNNYNVPKSKRVFNISEILKPEVSQEQPTKDNSSPPDTEPSPENPQPSQPKTGGKRRETRKNKRNKKMRKTKRYRIR